MFEVDVTSATVKSQSTTLAHHRQLNQVNGSIPQRLSNFVSKSRMLKNTNSHQILGDQFKEERDSILGRD